MDDGLGVEARLEDAEEHVHGPGPGGEGREDWNNISESVGLEEGRDAREWRDEDHGPRSETCRRRSVAQDEREVGGGEEKEIAPSSAKVATRPAVTPVPRL